jgi:hypothetical protein
MQRALLSTAAAVILAVASITPAGAQHKGGGSGGGGASPGGVAHSAPSAGGGGSAFRGGGTQFQGGGMQFRGGGGMQFRGGGNAGNMNAFRGQVGGNQFRAVSPASRNFAQGHFAQTRPFRQGRSVVRFGAPFFYDDYGYYPYSSYGYDDECYETRRVWTDAGWRYAEVYVCEQ